METLRRQLTAIPAEPGVYLFYDEAGQLLYVGKAALLRHRVRQYFQPGYGGHNAAKQRMIAEISSVEWETTESEIEALVQEAQLIKQHQPRYNVLLRDDKGFFWVIFTDNTFPCIRITHTSDATLFSPRRRRGENRRQTYAPIGPFTDGSALKKTLRLLRRIFPYCTCKKTHKRPCLNAQMGRCFGYCCSRNSAEKDVKRSDVKIRTSKAQEKRYLTGIRAIRRVLMGRSQKLLDILKTQMNSAAQTQQFERAQKLNEQQEALKTILRHSHILHAPAVPRRRDPERAMTALQTLFAMDSSPRRIEAYDVANLRTEAPTGSMVVASNGAMNRSEYRQFHLSSAQNDVAGIQETLQRRLRHDEWPTPDIILVDGGTPQLSAAQETLMNVDSKSAPIIIALAKKEEKLYYATWKNPKKLEKIDVEAAYLLQCLRDEAHRFARRLHHKRRSANLQKETNSDIVDL